MTRQFRTALIGFGRIGSTYSEDPKIKKFFKYATHVEALEEHPLFELGAVVDTDEQAIHLAGQRLKNAQISSDLKAIAADYDPEIVVIATPPNVRMGIVNCFRNLLGVVVEKPLGRNTKEVKTFLGECDRLGVLVQVNLWRRADTFYRKLSGGGLTELIGEPQAVFGTYGGGLLNNGLHLVDFMRMLLGDIECVQWMGSVESSRSKGHFCEDVDPAFTLITNSGLPMSVQPLNYEYYREISLEVWGQEGKLMFANEGLTNLFFPRRPNRGLSGAEEIALEEGRRICPTVSDSIYRMYDNLASAINGDSLLWSSGDSSLMNAKVIDTLKLSYCRDGVSVAVE